MLKFIRTSKLILSIFVFSFAIHAAVANAETEDKQKGILLYNQFKAISAVRHLQAAANIGDSEAQYYLGEALRKNNRYITKEAQVAYEASAAQGNIYAMIRLAQTDSDLCVLMKNCPAGTKSPKEWAELAKKTAREQSQENNAEAMYLLYRITGQDEWLRKSAERDFALAQYHLAVEYKEGKGFFLTSSKRMEASEKWMKASAEGGNPRGMLAYGAIRGRLKDWESFRYWNQKAAESGFVSGVFGYGSYLAGDSPEYGFQEDLVTAYAYISWLLELDGGGGMLEFAQEDLPQIAARMTPEQIAKSKELLINWKLTRPPLSFFPEKL